jgi:aminopeptidase N
VKLAGLMPLEQRLHARCGCAGHFGFEQESSSARPFAFPTSPHQFERDRPFLVDHLALDLTLDVPQKSVRGAATLSVRRVDGEAETMPLDAIGFTVSSVKVDGAEVPVTYDGRLLHVPVPKDLETAIIIVTYSATPRRGLYFLEPDEHYPDRPSQVWSQCQEEDARHFIPCHDKPHVKMTSEVRLRVPNGWFALSNGDLVREERPEAPEPWSFHYKLEAPHPSYLLTIVAGEFAEIKAQAGNLPVQYYVPKSKEDDGRRTFARTPEMIAYFSKTTGVPYPWTRYSQIVVSDFIFGGMENTTATTMYEYILLDKRASIDVTSDDLIAHELAHQWFGDYITCRDWSEAWLNEGFATFMEHVWRDKHLGKDEYDYGVQGDLEAYLGEAHGRYLRPIVCQNYDAPLDLFDRHLYEKGGLVLHMLKTELGPSVFWQGIRLYLMQHARSVVETRDLQRALEEVSGKSLGRFFEQWVYKPGHPQVEVTLGWDKGILTVAAKQAQSTNEGVPNAFDLPLVLEVRDGSGIRTERLHIKERTESFAVPCPTRPTYVVVDPELSILGDVTVKGPGDMHQAALAGARSARGRWLAAKALSTFDDPKTIAALDAALFKKEEFWGVRAAAARALGQIRSKEAFDVLARGAKVEHPKVRRAVVDALARFRTTASVEILKKIALKDESYVVEAEAARSLGRTKQASAFDTLVDVLDRPSWADVISVGAVDGLAALRDDRASPHVLARTRYGQPARTRRAAVMALPKLGSDRKTRETLEDLLDDSDTMLRLDVARALAELGDAKARPALRERVEVELDPRVRRRLREAVRDLGHDTKKPVDALREELEKLQAEHAELRGRVAILEASSGAEKPNGKARSGAASGTGAEKGRGRGKGKERAKGNGKGARR